MAGWLSAQSPLGKLLRLPLRLIPPGSSVPILATPARGKRWIAGSGPHSCWLGWNELLKRSHFAREVRAGDVVYDIGANVGSYTVLASVLVGSAGRVIAFEPVAENVSYLRSHIRLNALDNVEVFELAVGDRSGTVSFRAHEDRLQGRVDPAGSEVVGVIALDDLRKEGRAPEPDCLKIDVEGGELSVLRGAAELMRGARPLIFLATHGERVREECLALLRGAGYDVVAIGRSGDEWIARPLPFRPTSRRSAEAREDSR
jgi:FkbM family methyltransferase